MFRIATICVLAMLFVCAGTVLGDYTKSVAVKVTEDSGKCETGDGGFAWKDAKLEAEGTTVNGSLKLKVWNDKRTPITQIYITVNRKVYKCVFDRVPRPSSQEDYVEVTFSCQINAPSVGNTYDLNLILTLTMSEEAGVDVVELEQQGYVAKFGEVTTE